MLRKVTIVRLVGVHISWKQGWGLFLPSLERGLQTLIYQKHTIQSSGGQRREGAPPLWVTTEVRRASCLFSLPRPCHDFWASSLPPGSYHLIEKGAGPTRTGPRSPGAQSVSSIVTTNLIQRSPGGFNHFNGGSVPGKRIKNLFKKKYFLFLMFFVHTTVWMRYGGHFSVIPLILKS